MKYKLRGTFEVEVFQEGMEDGYLCHDLSGKFLGFYEKGSPMPRVNQHPAIKSNYSERPSYYKVEPGDYIVTGENNLRQVYKPFEFVKKFEEIT